MNLKGKKRKMNPGKELIKIGKQLTVTSLSKILKEKFAGFKGANGPHIRAFDFTIFFSMRRNPGN